MEFHFCEYTTICLAAFLLKIELFQLELFPFGYIILDWPKNSFGFFHMMLWKDLNDIFGQCSALGSNKHYFLRLSVDIFTFLC